MWRVRIYSKGDGQRAGNRRHYPQAQGVLPKEFHRARQDIQVQHALVVEGDQQIIDLAFQHANDERANNPLVAADNVRDCAELPEAQSGGYHGEADDQEYFPLILAQPGPERAKPRARDEGSSITHAAQHPQREDIPITGVTRLDLQEPHGGVDQHHARQYQRGADGLTADVLDKLAQPCARRKAPVRLTPPHQNQQQGDSSREEQAAIPQIIPDVGKEKLPSQRQN
jgi:hypothetical protein